MIPSILATAGLSLVLYLTGFFVVFTPLPYLLTFFKKGWGSAIAAALMSVVLLFALYRLPAEPPGFLPMMAFFPSLPLKAVMGLSILYFSYFVWISCVVALGSGRLASLRMEPGFAAMMAAILLPIVAAYLLLSFLLELNLSQGVSQAFQALLQKMAEMQAASQAPGRISAEDLAYLREYGPGLVRGFFGVFPSLWIVFTMVVLSLNVLFARRWVPETRPFPQWEAFNLWRLGERWIWAPITVGALYFLNLYVLKNGILGLALLNALIVLGGVYFYQGLAVASFYLRKRFSPWTRLAATVAIFLFLQPIGVLVLALGVFDFWFDFRKLKKVA